MSFLTNLKPVRRIASVCFILHCDFFSLSGPSCLWEDSWAQLHVFPPTAKATRLTPVSYSRAPYVPSGWQHAPYSLRCLGSHLFIEEVCHSIPFGERQLHWDSPKGGSILGQVGLGCMLYQPYRKGTNPPCDTGSSHLVIASWLLYPQTDQLPLHILSFTAWAMQMHLPSLSLLLSVLVWVPIMLHECSCGDEQTFLHSK